jgi:hypothetical protein
MLEGMVSVSIEIIYLKIYSLVTLELNSLSVETAISQFKDICFLNLGEKSKVHWIANILLYIPLSFRAFATLSKTPHILAHAWLFLYAGFLYHIESFPRIGILGKGKPF